LQDVIQAGPVSIEALRLLKLPSLSGISLRALEVRDECVVRIHVIDDAVDGPVDEVSYALLLEASTAGDHAMLLYLPQGLQPRRSFQALGLRLGETLKLQRWGGRKGKRQSVDKLVASAERADDLKGWSKTALLEALKNKRSFKVLLRKLGWWNIDAPLPSLALLGGQALDLAGLPVPCGQVVAKARSFSSWFYAVTDQSGYFNFLLPKGSNCIYRIETCRPVADCTGEAGSCSKVAWSRLCSTSDASVFSMVELKNELGPLRPYYDRCKEVE